MSKIVKKSPPRPKTKPKAKTKAEENVSAPKLKVKPKAKAKPNAKTKAKPKAKAKPKVSKKVTAKVPENFVRWMSTDPIATFLNCEKFPEGHSIDRVDRLWVDHFPLYALAVATGHDFLWEYIERMHKINIYSTFDYPLLDEAGQRAGRRKLQGMPLSYFAHTPATVNSLYSNRSHLQRFSTKALNGRDVPLAWCDFVSDEVRESPEGRLIEDFEKYSNRQRREVIVEKGLLDLNPVQRMDAVLELIKKGLLV